MNLVPLAPAGVMFILAGLLVAAALEDAYRLRISNVTSGLILVGAVVVMVLNPSWNLWQNVAVCAALLAVGIPLFAAGKFGGGDIKLLAAIAAWFSAAGALQLLMWVFLSGGVLALLIIAARMMLSSEDHRSRWRVLRPKGGIPYGMAISAGALIAISQLT